MDITIHPTKLSGTVAAIPSKSQAHRLLICAAFADAPTELILSDTNRDIEATADCLNALGADIRRTDTGYSVAPIQNIPKTAILPCCESGSTLRFMLPIVGALGVDGTFLMEGRLPKRPLSPLWEEMERKGCRLSRPTENTLRCKGQLQSGSFSISGGVSSQFITGLLFAASLLKEDSRIEIIDKLESKPYIDMTLQAMETFGISVHNFTVSGCQQYHSPGILNVEGDWSNGAFFLAARALGNDIAVTGLNPQSAQGDRAVFDILQKLEHNITVSAADIPDLVPILAVVAAVKNGATFTDISRLRLKESDRVASVIAMIEALGGKAAATEHTLTVYPSKLHGGTVNAVGDHRIAMSAAIAASVASGDVTILGAECVSKSYPKFWEEYSRLGGKYEQHLR